MIKFSTYCSIGRLCRQGDPARHHQCHQHLAVRVAKGLRDMSQPPVEPRVHDRKYSGATREFDHPIHSRARTLTVYNTSLADAPASPLL